MFTHALIFSLAFGMIISAPAPKADPAPNPEPAANPSPNPGLTPIVYSPPVAVSYNAFSSVQTHPSPQLIVKSAPAVLPAVQAVPTVYALQAQTAPAVGYAVNYPYVVV